MGGCAKSGCYDAERPCASLVSGMAVSRWVFLVVLPTAFAAAPWFIGIPRDQPTNDPTAVGRVILLVSGFLPLEGVLLAFGYVAGQSALRRLLPMVPLAIVSVGFLVTHALTVVNNDDSIGWVGDAYFYGALCYFFQPFLAAGGYLTLRSLHGQAVIKTHEGR